MLIDYLFLVVHAAVTDRKVFGTFEKRAPGACFSKVPKLFGSLSGATIPVISLQRQGSKPSNFAVLLVFLTLKACLKISYSKQADCGLTTGFSGLSRNRPQGLKTTELLWE